MNNIIFDFDLTLINRSISDQYRKQRNWKKVFELIPQFTLYDGLNEFFFISEIIIFKLPLLVLQWLI